MDFLKPEQWKQKGPKLSTNTPATSVMKTFPNKFFFFKSSKISYHNDTKQAETAYLKTGIALFAFGIPGDRTLIISVQCRALFTSKMNYRNKITRDKLHPINTIPYTARLFKAAKKETLPNMHDVLSPPYKTMLSTGTLIGSRDAHSQNTCFRKMYYGTMQLFTYHNTHA